MPSVPDSPILAEWSLKKQVNEVNVLFVAIRHGRFAGDLAPQDVAVLDDNKPPAAILALRTERELPMRAGLLIDTSSSVTSRFRFEQGAATMFLRHALNGGADRAFVLGFNDHARLMQDLTDDPELLSQAIERLTSGGGTALYDAVRAACERLQDRAEPQMVSRILVIVSDGQNNAGRLSLSAAVDAAQQSEVTIYAVSTNYPHGANYSQDLAAQQGNANLRALAEQTGGRVLYPVRPAYLSKAFAEINEELRSRYAVAYRPADFLADGHYHKIKIEVRKAGEKLHVRARKGYRATFTYFLQPDSPETEESLRLPRR